ncbi:MAG: gamma-glutamyltransferase, partial [Pseudomonadales bacterium]|nr:gamma-glutamyltransferase [Pseudomonadales bacterium]
MQLMGFVRTFSLCCLLVLTGVADAASRQPVRSDGGMVVTASDIASQIGADILERGGNAVDAGVAVGFALAVTFPSAGNIGGGGFMVIYDASQQRATAIDYREMAPLGADKDMYLDEEDNVIEGLPTDGHMAVAVPGTVAGLLYALENYGTMDRKQVISPAIDLARKGFTVNWHLARSLERSGERLSRHSESKRIFLNDGEYWKAG